MDKLSCILTWILTETKNGKPAIEAWLPGQTRYPALRISGKAVLEPSALTVGKGYYSQEVFQGDMAPFIRSVRSRGELTLEMSFSVASKRLVNERWFNNRINVAFVDGNGNERSGSIGPFNYNIGYNITNGPQWVFGGKEYVDIIHGNLVATFKAMVEDEYRSLIGKKAESLASAYKRKNHKAKVSKSLSKELKAMTPDEGIHNAFCSKCNFFVKSEKLHAGEIREYSCALGVFAAFSSTEITEDIRERCGCSSQGSVLKSSRPDARWFWAEEEDVALSLNDWICIGRTIDEESEFCSELEMKFSGFDFLYDDVAWIGHLHKRVGLVGIEDLDRSINEHRDALLKKLQGRYARMFPAYDDLFLQRAPSAFNQDAAVEMCHEEVGEKAHTITEDNFLDTNLLQACGLGNRSVCNKDGKWTTYINRGYPMPDEEDFGYDVLSKF